MRMAGVGSKENKESGKPKSPYVSKYLLTVSAFQVCWWVGWGEVAVEPWARWTEPVRGQRPSNESWSREINKIISDNGKCQEDDKTGHVTVVGGVGVSGVTFEVRGWESEGLGVMSNQPWGSREEGWVSLSDSDSRNQNRRRTFSVFGW